MNSTLTRREFLQSLVPPWFTVHNLKLAGIVAAVVLVLSFVVSFVRQMGLRSTLNLFLFALGGALVLWLLAKLLGFMDRFFQKIRPNIPSPAAAFFVVAGRWITILICGAAGAYYYSRWRQGVDMTGPAISLGAIFLGQFLSECRAQSNPAPEIK